MNKMVKGLLAGITVTSLAACSGDGSSGGGTGTVKLSLANTTAGALALTGDGVSMMAAPTSYKARLIAVKLNRTRMSNGTLIWLNPNCSDEQTCTTDLTGGVNGASGNGGFFEFSRASADVNVDLNSQGRELAAGTYVDVSMVFCGSDQIGNEDDPSYINVNTDDGTGKIPCTYASEVFATPLELKDGETATVTLSYDLDGKNKTVPPTFVPSATKD